MEMVACPLAPVFLRTFGEERDAPGQNGDVPELGKLIADGLLTKLEPW